MSYEKDLNIVLGAINMITAFTSIPQSEKEELKEGIKEVYAKAEKSDENERKAEMCEGIFIDYSTATAEHRFSLNDESAREFGYTVEELLNNYESGAE